MNDTALARAKAALHELYELVQEEHAGYIECWLEEMEHWSDSELDE
jgi:hypothetical protein